MSITVGRTTFDILARTDDVIFITDKYKSGFVSVTNAAEEVVAKIAETDRDRKIVYVDTGGRWDELVHDKGEFKGFGLHNGWVPAYYDTNSREAPFERRAKADLEARCEAFKAANLDVTDAYVVSHRSDSPFHDVDCIEVLVADRSGLDRGAEFKFRVFINGDGGVRSSDVEHSPDRNTAFEGPVGFPAYVTGIGIAAEQSMKFWRDQQPDPHAKPKMPDLDAVRGRDPQEVLPYIERARESGAGHDPFLVLKDDKGAIIAAARDGEALATSGAYADVKRVDVLEHAEYWAPKPEQANLRTNAPGDYSLFREGYLQRWDQCFRDAKHMEIAPAYGDCDIPAPIEAIGDCKEWIINKDPSLAKDPDALHKSSKDLATAVCPNGPTETYYSIVGDNEAAEIARAAKIVTSAHDGGRDIPGLAALSRTSVSEDERKHAAAR